MAGFWENRKVLVTGADGFIGSQLTESLVRRGACVRGFVYYNSFGASGWLDRSDVLDSIEIFPGDIRDPGRVANAVRDQSFVFHLASLIAIPYSYHAPDSYVQTNVGGALNVLNACRDSKVERLIHTSTSEVYGTARYAPIDELHPLQAQSPYSATKIAADKLAESYHCSYGLPVTIVRPFNTYGPRQSSRAVIPSILKQLWSGATTLDLGALHPTRDFTFVHDTVTGFLAAAESESAVGSVLNVGTGQEISIGDLVELLFGIVGRRVAIRCREERLRPNQSEVERLLCNPDRMQRLTGWGAKYTLEQGLALTSRWVADNLNGSKGGEFIL